MKKYNQLYIMSYSNGLLQSNTNNIAGIKGKDGKDGVGFKQTSSGDYDMDNKILFNVKTQDDVPEDSDYDSIKKDYESAVSKNYLRNNFLKRDSKTQTFFDLRGYSIQNSEVYNPDSWNDKTITNKEYVDLRDNLKADKTELVKKADLETSDEQTFKGILNVPDFDSGYSNMSNVMNKKYIDSTFLTKTTGTVLANSIQTKSDKSYVDNNFLTKQAGDAFAYSIQNKADINDVMTLDGRNAMEANLDIGGYNITNLKKPSDDLDAVNKKYLEDHVGESHVQSANAENKFKYIMDDPGAQLSEEDDVKLGNIVTYQNSPHQINKKVVDMKLLLDSSKGYYSSRVGLNLYPLSNGEYTVCLELMWVNNDIDSNSLQIDGSSSIENIHNVNRKTFKTQKYVRLICQFTKSQNIGNNYLYIDVIMKMKTGSSYDQELQTYFTVYGISGHQSNIDKNIYDSFMNFENDEINFEKSIDMNDNLIIGVKNADRDKGAVNLKQVTDLLNNRFLALISQINTKQNKGNYQLIFEYYFDLQLDPDSFDMANTYGSNIDSIGGKLILRNKISLSDYDSNTGFSLEGSYIKLDTNLSQNTDYTIFVSFQHDTKFLYPSNKIGLKSLDSGIDIPHIIILPRNFIFKYDSVKTNINGNILSEYQNKNLMLWFCKHNDTYKAILCQGAHINKTITSFSYQANEIYIDLPYKIYRLGFSPNFYDIYDKEFHNISFLEKANGTYFE